MPTRYDEDDDLPAHGDRDREISLGTGTVLAIFLAMALVCSLFFGLGYSMGRKSAPATSAASPVPSSSFSSGNSRKSSLAPEGDATPPEHQVTQPFEESPSGRPASTPGSPTLNPVIPSERDSRPARGLGQEVEGPASARHLPSSKSSSTAAVLPVLPVPVPTPGDPSTQSFVQIAAVSRKEDADLLLTALKRRGYTGIIRQQSQDKLLHIQVGPFATKKDAEAMRQRLITDGYNPILK